MWFLKLLLLSHPGTGIIAKSFVNVCPAIRHHDLNGIPYPPGIQNFSTRKAQPCSFIGWTINIYSTVCIFHSTKINGFTIKFCHRSSFYVSISNFLQLYSEIDEMKNFLITFLIKYIFSTFIPIYATKASWKFINFNLMMWDIEADNLDPKKTLK